MAGPLDNWLRIPSRSERLRAANIREDVIRAAERTAFGRQSDGLLGYLPRLLDEDELVVQIVEGRHERAVGLLVLTSRRIVFSPKTARRGPALSIPVADVVTATARRHRGLGVLELVTRAGELTVDQILGNQADTFAGSLLRVQADSTVEDPPTEDPLTELGQLRALHEAGVIDDVEFGIRKRRLFDQI